MKVNQSSALPQHLLDQGAKVGYLVTRLRQARKLRQEDAAVRAGISRNTAYRVEKGDPGLAMGVLMRYVDAIAPGTTLKDLLMESDPALVAQQVREQGKRVRPLSSAELDNLDF